MITICRECNDERKGTIFLPRSQTRTVGRDTATSIIARIRSACVLRLCGQEDIEKGRSIGRKTSRRVIRDFCHNMLLPYFLPHRRLAIEKRGAVGRPVGRRVELDAAIAGRERSNGEIPPGGMRCFPFMPPEGYWKGDTKSRATPYGATPGSGTTVASCTTWYNLASVYNIGFTCNEACTCMSVCVCVRARARVCVAFSSRNVVRSRYRFPFSSRDL